MNTMTADSAIRVAAAAVIGARHLRAARNGQDAAIAWAGAETAAVVVCDGCGASPSSEVGARLGASLVIRSLAQRLSRGERPACDELWTGVRADVARALAIVL